jgi:DNA mismatch endonuclease (patch repair protein)
MAKVRGKGNRSTEVRVEAALIEENIEGWEKHPKGVLGKPDFFFPELKLAVFVDGCFWHVCPRCNRNVPTSRREFWENKLDENRRRDNRTHRKLRQMGYHVMRVWEHDLSSTLYKTQVDRQW